MARIVILGNSGSGKSSLARRLSEQFGLPIIHLDGLFWEPGGFDRKRSKETVYAEIATLATGQCWIVEGVFGELVQAFLPNADLLIWLNLDWATCRQSLLQRGSESSKQLDRQAAETNFTKLIEWAAAYWQRDDARSYQGHQALFTQFGGDKHSFTTRSEVDAFVASLAPGAPSSPAASPP
jgi:adenylate kinase family enzyme